MKIRILFLFTFLLFSASLYAQIIGNNSIDFSGMKPFWQIESSLIKDKEPPPGEWNALFNSPAYQILFAGGFSQKNFEHQLRLAFMPSMDSVLNIALKKNDQQSEYLDHYLLIKGKEKKLKELQTKLQKEQLIETALSMARNFLPDSFSIDNSLPPVSFAIFENSTTRAPSGIIIDLVFSMDFDSYLPYLLAHEAYHIYRDKIRNTHYPDKHQPDYPMVQMLTQMETEGIADLIDKKKFFLKKGSFSNCDWAKSYQHYLDKAPKTIRELDKYFTQMAAFPNSDRKIIQDLIPMNGHPTGYFMANAIMQKMGKRTLIKQTANPFAFFRLYQRVALKDKKHYPPFSSATMQYLHEMEQKYVPSKNSLPPAPEQPSSPKLMWYEKDKVQYNW
ncbi:DUF5700 domain-containing putative Zn-dependent protease [Prolixibacter denitrificans]|uniref:DUF2268 domain-containing protein n=1 Tax=Prolixibacter denitrificans TaxID=1541063 RepID=A0A2P8C6B1_9BACT|nr:DUF5700 domain-containing putative Zn-dependent protease [Prolixibacter denitrificans]PSK80477.1 hypothetical protein CLV93_1157 [Prolixibacter denitrificans]GET22745.1 hypothetical protein JCM18694_29910 [Prolixibacter denitrificans]